MIPWRIAAAPFLIGAIFYLYKTFEDSSYSLHIIPFVVMLAVVYIFNPQINWWWYKRNPPKLAKGIAMFLQKNSRFYQNLSLENKKLFRDRISLSMIAYDYKPMVFEKVPEDVKAIVSACAVTTTLGRPDFLFPNFENIILYPKGFPSPQYPRNIHPSEIYDHDGVVMFSAEHLLLGFSTPQQYFNVGLYEYAKVFIESYPTENWPELGEDSWEKLQQVSGFGKDAIFKYMNLDDITPLPVSITFFFDFPKQLKAVLPELYDSFKDIFKQDPAL